MNLKKYICLGLFILPVLGMIMILWNYVSPVDSLSKEKGAENDKYYTSSVNSESSEEVGTSEPTSEWITRNVGGKETSYKYSQKLNVQNCKIDENIKNMSKDGKRVDPLAPLNRVDYLEIILKAHCIDYTKADTSNIAFDDVDNTDKKSKQIIKTAMDLGIAKGYDENGKNVFKANQVIPKIEALAILLSLSEIQLKDKAPANNFVDVEDNWKRAVADISHRLQLTPIDEGKNMFFPEYAMKRGDSYNLLEQLARYY